MALCPYVAHASGFEFRSPDGQQWNKNLHIKVSPCNDIRYDLHQIPGVSIKVRCSKLIIFYEWCDTTMQYFEHKKLRLLSSCV